MKVLDLTQLTRYDEKIKAYVDAKAAEAASGKITMVAVNALPAVAEASHNVIYLVPNTKQSGSNVKDEYILVGEGVSAAFELIGTTQIDMDSKADKVVPAAVGNLAALDANGNLVDGGAKSQFAAASHTHTVSDITDLAAITTGEIDALFPSAQAEE